MTAAQNKSAPIPHRQRLEAASGMQVSLGAYLPRRKTAGALFNTFGDFVDIRGCEMLLRGHADPGVEGGFGAGTIALPVNPVGLIKRIVAAREGRTVPENI